MRKCCYNALYDKTRKKLVCYFLSVLLVRKSILVFMLSSRGKSACLRCCMVLSFFYAYSYFTVNPNQTGLFLICLGLEGGGGGGGCRPPLSSLFVNLSQRNFVQGLKIKALAQIWKKLHKINDVIDNDVVIVRNLAEKTVKRVYFKIAAASSIFIQFY